MTNYSEYKVYYPICCILMVTKIWEQIGFWQQSAQWKIIHAKFLVKIQISMIIKYSVFRLPHVLNLLYVFDLKNLPTNKEKGGQKKGGSKNYVPFTMLTRGPPESPEQIEAPS